ncbi:MAG: hypothetical protein JRS35_19535 [Deltaproteobacteria bacterium]|nr:hypothetical protein [Deltaproteobacteria bacterium]
MNIVVRLMLVSMLMLVAAPAYSAEATQMWKCEMDDDASEADVVAGAAEWLKAAKTMEGGANLQASVYFPVAVNAIGEVDAFFIVVAPTFAEWGKFWDNYTGSPAEAVDIKNRDDVVCPDSALWESVKIK